MLRAVTGVTNCPRLETKQFNDRVFGKVRNDVRPMAPVS